MIVVHVLLYLMLSDMSNSQVDSVSLNEPNGITQDVNSQIGEYVTSVYEDSKGHIWFGTLQKGIARYDGKELKYFSVGDGFLTARIISVVEDSKGVYWFATGEGLANYDGHTVTNYQIKPGDFASNMVSQVFIDSKGSFWIGTWGGVFRFDGEEFKEFSIPYPRVSTTINEDTKNWITKITEDVHGNIWISRDGYGASKYDGASFKHYLKQDGLLSNNVTEIEVDNAGDIWFGTRVSEKDKSDPNKREGPGGLNKLTNNGIISFPEIESLNKNDVYEIYIDSSGYVWVSTIGDGVYRYDGNDFMKYDVPIAIMSMSKDSKGNLWLGGSGGLYRIDKNGEIDNVTSGGPW